MLQRTKFKITLYTVILANLFLLLGFGIYWLRAQNRDYQRLADLKVWQNILGDHFLKFGTYRLDNCQIGQTLSQCWAEKSGQVWINNINDPLNSGSYRYLVAGLADDDYQINFSLEAGIGGLSPGTYVLTKNGVIH